MNFKILPYHSLATKANLQNPVIWKESPSQHESARFSFSQMEHEDLDSTGRRERKKKGLLV